MKKNIILLIYFLWNCNLFLSAQFNEDSVKIISLLPVNESFSINTSVYYFEDKKNNLSFEDIIKPDFSDKFILNTKNKLNFGYTNSTFWVKFHLKNTQPQVNNWLFEIEQQHMDSIDFFYTDQQNHWKSKQYGDMYPFRQREWDYRTFIIPLELPDTATKTYYVRFRATGTMQFPMNIHREKSCFRKILLSEQYYGIFFGIMFLLIIYNIFIYFSLRDISYFYYIILIISSTIFLAFLSGHIFQYVLHDLMWWSNKLFPSSVALAEFCMISFTRSFLNVKKYSPRLDKILTGFLILSIILIFLLFLVNYHISMQIAAYTAQLYIILCLISGIICLIKGNRSARLFIIANTLFLMGALAISFSALGILRENVFTVSHGMELGGMLNGIFLSLALIDNYRISKIEKEKAQEEIIHMRKKATEVLEQKVIERTRQIEQQNKKITDSIHYASRIQNALLPLKKDLDNLLKSYFILNKPRDIVSGDYYWITNKNNKVIVAVADCTGHGVPGAFMSILGIALLNEIVNKAEAILANDILNHLREQLIKSLRQTGKNDKTKDGIEIALCVVDFNSKKLQYAGAFRPLYLIRNNNLSEMKGDYMPIGIYEAEKRPFSIKEIHFKENDVIYMFSDGYPDQIGGPDRKTFRLKQFKELLMNIHQKPLHEQKTILENKHKEWKLDVEQIDDILVMGIRFTEY